MNFTTEQQLDNVNLAARLWRERVDPEKVNLEVWQCGTYACFGGHLQGWPEFQAMGVVPTYLGGPECRDATGQTTHDAWGVAEALFGDEGLFWQRGDHDADPYDGQDTDYQVVLARLAYARERLEAEL